MFCFSGFIAKKQALLMGLGFGWMPLYLVARELKNGRLRELRYLGGSRFRFTPLLVHRLDRPPGRTATRLAALLRDPLVESRNRRGARARSVTGRGVRSVRVPRESGSSS